MRRLALLVAVAAIPTAPALAHARANCHWGRRCRITQHHEPTARQAVIYGARIPAISRPPSAALPLTGIAADGLASYNVTNDPAKYLAMYGGNVLRIIVNPSNTPQDASQIVRYALDAERDGYRISLVIQWADWQGLDRAILFYRTALRLYRAIHPWATSIGNEQELTQGHTFTPADYAEFWRILAPMVRHRWPRTILVAGEVSPWGFAWFVQVLKQGLPGMQAIAGHPYRIRWWFSIKDFVKLAHRYHVQAWITEGLAGPDAWPDCAYNASWAKLDIGYYQRRPCEGYSGDVPSDQMQGVAVKIAWMIGSRELGPSPVLPPPGRTT